MVTLPPFGRGVVATFIIDTPAIFALGLVTSLFAVEHRSASSFARTWPFVPGLVLTTLGLAIALGSYAVAPDWMVMYFLPDARLGAGTLAYGALILYYAPYALGFALGLDLRRRCRTHVVLALLATGLLEGALVAAVLERYVRVGTRAEWLAGGGVALARHVEVGRVSAAGGLLMVLVLALMVRGHVVRRRLWRQGAYGTPRYLNDAEERIVAAAARRIVPAADSLAMARELSTYVADLVGVNRAAIRLVTWALQFMPLWLGPRRRRFTALSKADQDAYLTRVEHHASDQVRSVLIFLKTLLCILFYDRPENLAAIGMDHHCRQEDRPPAFPETPRRAAAETPA